MPDLSTAAPSTGEARSVGVAYLTLAPLSAPESVLVAAQAGYDFVGVRVKPFDDRDPDPGMAAGSPMLRETRRRLDDTGLKVLDIEFILLTEAISESDWLPALEAGAELGASLVSVAVADQDQGRAVNNLAALVAAAAEYGIRPALEAISYQRLRSLSDAVQVAQSTGSTLLLDPLHLTRSGADLTSIGSIDPALVPVIQLCDAPLLGPETVAALAQESRFGRLPVGEGTLPLADFLAAGPAGAPVSVEVPNTALRSGMSDLEFAVMNLRAARALIDAAGASEGESLG